MSSTPAILKGTIHGRTINLEDEPGLPDGQRVTVTVVPAAQNALNGETPLDALKRAAGSWCDDPDGLDRFLEWNRQQRKLHQRLLPE
jgi:hypothetical protein